LPPLPPADDDLEPQEAVKRQPVARPTMSCRDLERGEKNNMARILGPD